MRALGRAEVTFTRLLAGMPDACPALAKWRDAGFTKAATPGSTGGRRADVDAAKRDLDVVDRGSRVVDRYGGVRGEAAAELMRGALDEVDALVIDDCDPVARMVLPDSVETCTP